MPSLPSDPTLPFDPAQWTTHDLYRTVRNARPRFDWAVEGLDQAGTDDLAAELDELVAEHSADTTARIDLERAVERIEAVLAAAARVVADRRPSAGGPGRLVGTFSSTGGVPKLPVDGATIDVHGIVGDIQTDRTNHGRVWQALCLWSAEVVDALVAEGHPLTPGAAGENLSVAGLHWAAIRPGVVLGIGADVAVQVSAYATPCAKNAQWFTDRNFRRMDHDRHPGWSRAYASVLRPGVVAVGDTVVVDP